jgi:glycosyltransferase involved in cell wall biosynthesis
MNPLAAYYWEQVSFGAALAPALLASPPDIVHLSDPAIANLLLRFRKATGLRFRIVYCNGGGLTPEHYRRYDHVQLVSPPQAEEAERAGLPPDRFSLVPLGVDLPAAPSERATAIRRRLDLPGGPLCITVAALERSGKRLDYLVEELSRPAGNGWSLLCLGQRTAETPALEALAARLLPGRALFRTVVADAVSLHLAAADLFALPSAREGFGLAAVEALAAGLPVVVRDIPALRHIVQDPEQIAPLEAPGEIAPHLAAALAPAVRDARGVRNRARARRFAWPSLVPEYLAMYERALATSASPERD